MRVVLLKLYPRNVFKIGDKGFKAPVSFNIIFVMDLEQTWRHSCYFERLSSICCSESVDLVIFRGSKNLTEVSESANITSGLLNNGV